MTKTASNGTGSIVPLIAVSIINYKTAQMTARCVASVLADIATLPADQAPRVRIAIVDNLSQDGSVEFLTDWIAENDPGGHVTLVASATNSGFSGGHNQGIGAFPDAESFLILNSDALLRIGFLAEMLAALEAAGPRDGLFAPVIEHDDGTAHTSAFRQHSWASELIRGASTGAVRKIFEKRDVPLPLPPREQDIEWASFACILLRRATHRDVGIMDEGYFLYYEDAEYCWRAAQKGWTIRTVPSARAVHFRGGSGPVKSRQKSGVRLPRYLYVARSRYLYQTRGRVGLLAANLAWHLGDALRGLRNLVRGDKPPPTEAESRDIWIGFANPLAVFRPDGNDPNK